MNWNRIFTGIIISIFFFLFNYVGGIFFASFIAFIAAIAVSEFHRLVIEEMVDFSVIFLHWFGIIYSVVFLLLVYIYDVFYVPIFLSLNVFVVVIISVFAFRNNRNFLLFSMKQLAAILFIPLSLSYLVSIRNNEYGLEKVLILVLIVAISDTGAYYIGKYFGRNKLCQYISPKKTIEGSFAGLFCSVFFIFFIRKYLTTSLSMFFCIFFPVIVSLSGQLGDLFISEFKRLANVKDSGIILPGHGGVLDRIDGLLFAVPVGYFLLSIF